MTVAVLGSGDEWLSLALKFAASGVKTRALATDREDGQALANGMLPRTGLPPAAERLMLKAREKGTLEAAESAEDVEACEAIVLAPQLTGDRAKKSFDLGPLAVLIDGLTGHIAPGALLVVAARVPPGTIHDFVRPRVERAAGQQAYVGVFLAAVPERVLGADLFEFPERYNRVIGRADATSAKRAIDLYKAISRGELDPCDLPTAALVASAEGAIIEVQRALSTELALACDAFGASPSRLRELLKKSPRRGMELPRADVAPLWPPDDTTLLKSATHNRLRLPLIDAADATFSNTPRVLARLALRALKRARKDPKFSKVAVLGLASEPNTASSAGSPTLAFLEELKVLGFAHVQVHDPHARGTDHVRLVSDVDEVVAGADVLALMTPHEFYLGRTPDLLQRLQAGAAVVDARGVLARAEIQRRGLAYVGLAR
jgi:UDP-N-acetyl-D-mannosaminuronic acid dehydrogenase